MPWNKSTFPSFTPAIGGEPYEGLFTPTIDQKHRLGAKYTDGLGRVYRYVKAGGTALAPGLMCSGEATNANVKDIAQTGYTTAVGDNPITALVTTSNGITDGELVDGTLTVVLGTGDAVAYGIANNTYITSDTVMRVDLYEPIRVATAATDTFTFTKNRHRDVIVCATDATAIVCGVPPTTITASYYGWLQTGGPCGIVVDTAETVVIGCEVGLPAASAVAGACGVAAITEATWGICMEVAAAASTALVDLTLDRP